MLPPPTPDEELMLRVQDGDQSAYRELFERHHARVYGYLLRRMQDRQVADGLVQETFLSVYRARHTWKADRPFRPWLFTIASNAARDHLRRVQRRPETVSEDVVQSFSPTNVTRLHLERAIAGMPGVLRDAFILGVVEGFDHREVAHQLQISPANARARISRGRAWLRSRLHPETS